MRKAKVRSDFDEKMMRYALSLADKAEALGEIPVGAVLVDDEGKIVAEGWNLSIIQHDPTAHAEIVALRQAGQAQQNYRLLNTTLYVTLEPCTMCAGAILHSRIKRLVFGAYDLKTGAVGSRFHFFDDYKMNHSLEITGGVLQEECSQKLSTFFQKRREQKKQEKLAQKNINENLDEKK
ncbi:tRNA adenosine(34) deaminase TadA [Avibacterium endocarditidis]|uniref:tRNA adenosine(34) deaminase TadA n=1 Tax=Avibacterium endocarditidis TaxID=380674 RepID=UPI003BF8D1F9